MSKLAPYIFRMLLGAFIIGVAVGVLYYSWNALAVIFPDDLLGQAFGIMLFDVAAFIWFGTLVYLSRSTFQYVWAAVGFFIGLIGSLGLIGIEVGLNSGIFQIADVAKPMTYIFIGVLFGHLILIYARHSAEPEVSAGISMGIDKAKVTDEAQKKAEKRIEQNIEALSNAIGDDIFGQVVKDLRLNVRVTDQGAPVQFQMMEPPKMEELQNDPGFLSRWFGWVDRGAKKQTMNAQSVAGAFPVVTPKPSPAPLDAGSDEAEEEKPKK